MISSIDAANEQDRHRRKIRIALLSVASNTALVLMKLIIGVAIGSVSVISEAIHSGIDLVAAVIAWFSVSTAGKPPDDEHPFGHGKIENISGAVEGALILLAASWIIYEAVVKLLHPKPVETALWGVGIMLVSAIVNLIVSRRLFEVGEETDSVALKADAWHLKTDVHTSLGVMAGLAMIWVAQTIMPSYDFHWLDPVCAILVALMIIKTAWKLTTEAARDLLDANLPEHEEASVRALIESRRDVVRGYHYLRTRKAGHFRFVEFHAQVAREMSVDGSHRLTQELADAIKGRLSNTTVTIHIEPCSGECNAKCLSGCLLTEETRRDIANRSPKA